MGRLQDDHQSFMDAARKSKVVFAPLFGRACFACGRCSLAVCRLLGALCGWGRTENEFGFVIRAIGKGNNTFGCCNRNIWLRTARPSVCHTS